MTNFITRLRELAGADIANALVAEFGGSTVYIANPGTSPANSPDPVTLARVLACSADGLAEAAQALDDAYRDEIARLMRGALTSTQPATRSEWLAEAQRIVLQRLVLIDWIAKKKALSSPPSAQS